jgi:hypothetical protein
MFVKKSDNNHIVKDTFYLKIDTIGVRIFYCLIIDKDNNKCINKNFIPPLQVNSNSQSLNSNFNSIDLFIEKKSIVISYEYTSVRPVYRFDLYFSLNNLQLDSISTADFIFEKSNYQYKTFFCNKDFEKVDLCHFSLNKNDSISLGKILKNKP